MNPRKRRSARIWVAVLIIGAATIWLAWPRIAGTPAWLNEIGLLAWLKGLAPLDQWFIAFGTVGAVLYAIFSETFLLWFRRPKLRVLFDEAEPFVIQIPILRGNGLSPNPSFQFRILVRNEGTRRAKAVSVYARKLYRRGESGLSMMSWFIPMDLKWAEDEKTPTAISSGVERTCNVIGIERPGGPASAGSIIRTRMGPPQEPDEFDYETTCHAVIHTWANVTSYSNLVFPGTYRLELVVSAANSKSQQLAVDFRFDGQWFENRQEMIPSSASFSVRSLRTHSAKSNRAAIG